jgi:hypothetical protein
MRDRGANTKQYLIYEKLCALILSRDGNATAAGVAQASGQLESTTNSFLSRLTALGVLTQIAARTYAPADGGALPPYEAMNERLKLFNRTSKKVYRKRTIQRRAILGTSAPNQPKLKATTNFPSMMPVPNDADLLLGALARFERYLKHAPLIDSIIDQIEKKKH